ncbi:R3H domain-containing nucleic acid-binding protein [uncultured Pseudokineococcus sp.]|uniref:Jag family protein n=1 Tax=uncultured Pseudokineococcus sp. TaxID=1642928 RepID=UPI002604C365|nr:R3H domain-containing nucleic acid-binding protein [uncultured Pseudokineococcus sp.]
MTTSENEQDEAVPAQAPAAGADSVAAGAEGDAGVVGEGGEQATSGRSRLEEDGDVAADYLEELLDIADLDGDLDIDVEDGRASVSVLEDESAPGSLRQLVGPDGQVLDALQELTRLAVQARTGERSRLVLDVAGYRAQRRTVLSAMASEAVEQVRAGAEAVHLAPMNPYERKIVHDVIAEAGLRSESEGTSADRHVVVTAAS